MARAQRLSLVVTLVCALFLRVLVPVGWMPAAHGGTFAIAPCPATGPVPMAMETHGKSTDGHAPHKDQHSGECAFSPFHAGFTSAETAAPLPQPSQVASGPRDFASSVVRATGPPALPPPSTGPPALA
jgi:hypothetical protein